VIWLVIVILSMAYLVMRLTQASHELTKMIDRQIALEESSLSSIFSPM
jgi:hypothetical protein